MLCDYMEFIKVNKKKLHTWWAGEAKQHSHRVCAQHCSVVWHREVAMTNTRTCWEGP